jgi:hypothetical protein
MFSKKEIANIILHVVFISTFIAIFFFTYAAKVEEEIVKLQVQYLVDDLTTNAFLLPDHIKKSIKIKLDNITLPDLQSADNAVKEQNKKLMDHAIKIMLVFSVFGLLSAYYMSSVYDFSFIELLKENALAIVFVALTEYLFLNYVVKNYISADPHYVKRTFLNELHKDSNHNNGYDEEVLNNANSNILSNVEPNVEPSTDSTNVHNYLMEPISLMESDYADITNYNINDNYAIIDEPLKYLNHILPESSGKSMDPFYHVMV